MRASGLVRQGAMTAAQTLRVGREAVRSSFMKIGFDGTAEGLGVGCEREEGRKDDSKVK